MSGFDDVSPEVGELDHAAVTEAHGRDPDTTLELVVEMTRATDPALREAARRLAARLLWDDARSGRGRRRGVGRMESRRGEPDGDLDLERILDTVLAARAASAAVDAEQLWTRRWRRADTAWCLVLDRSGSMKGAALSTAAMATAAFLLRARGERSVLAFADDVVALTGMREQRSDDDVLDRVLGLRGDGGTELAAALRAAADQMGRATARRRVTVLLSDCRAGSREDVVSAAALHEELVVLAPADEPEAAFELGRTTGARVATVRRPTDVPAALAEVLDRGGSEAGVRRGEPGEPGLQPDAG